MLNGCDGKSDPNTDNDLSIMESSNLQNNQEDEIDIADTVEVKAQVQVFEGGYIDEFSASCEVPGDLPPDTPRIYYTIRVSNVTDTSFDFEVLEVYRGEWKEEGISEVGLIFPVSTAVFIGDGTEAAYYGDRQTFYFTFPWLGSDSEVRSMEISGFDLLEGKTFSNGSIPGYEFGCYQKSNELL